MFARRQAPEATSCDVPSAVARVLRAAEAAQGEREGGVARACQEALATLDAVCDVVSTASRLVREAAMQVIEAAGAAEAERPLLAERYDDARQRIDSVLDDAPPEALRLLGPNAERVTVTLRGAEYAISPFPLSTDRAGLDLPPPAHDFASHAEVADTLRRVEVALERIGRVKRIYQEDAAFLALHSGRR